MEEDRCNPSRYSGSSETRKEPGGDLGSASECTPPHGYFDWIEGNPIRHLLRYLFFGVGEVAPVTRETLRAAEPDPDRRPVIHVARTIPPSPPPVGLASCVFARSL